MVEAGSLEEAELIKLFNNTYRDTSFAIANTFNLIAQSFNLDGSAVIDISNYNYEEVQFPSQALFLDHVWKKMHILSIIWKTGTKDFLLGIRKANENMEDRVTNFIKEVFLYLSPQKF